VTRFGYILPVSNYHVKAILSICKQHGYYAAKLLFVNESNISHPQYVIMPDIIIVEKAQLN
jgi:hypothetical protein